MQRRIWKYAALSTAGAFLLQAAGCGLTLQQTLMDVMTNVILSAVSNALLTALSTTPA